MMVSTTGGDEDNEVESLIEDKMFSNEKIRRESCESEIRENIYCCVRPLYLSEIVFECVQ